MPKDQAASAPRNTLAELAFLHAPDASFIVQDRVILHANLRVTDVFGWERSAIEGKSMRLLYPDETDFTRVGLRAKRQFLRQPRIKDTRFMRHRDGSILWMEGQGVTLSPENPMHLALWSYRLLHHPSPNTPPPPHMGINFTAAELRVAHHMISGKTSKEIARLTGSSPRTIEVHRANMIRKTGVKNSLELIRLLLDRGTG